MARVGLPFHQVVNQFMRQFGRACASNLWNSYQKFHTANKAQEIARIGQADITASTPGMLYGCRVVHMALTITISANNEEVLYPFSRGLS